MKKKITAIIIALTLLLSAVPISVNAESQTDLSDGYELLYDGEPWKVYSLENTDDTISLDELNITLKDPSGNEVPKDAYKLVIGYEDGWDEENSCPAIDPFNGPYGLDKAEGMGFYAAYAVAEENSGYIGKTQAQSFMTFHKYSLNYVGCNATFGDRYEKPCTWSWHNFFEIPASEIKEPVVRDITLEAIDPEQYTITYFERVTGVPLSDGDDYTKKVYPEDKPLAAMPAKAGHYFARIDGKAPYYGSGWVDFDITGPSSVDLSDGYTLLFNGEEWGDYILDGKSDTLSAEDLNLTVVNSNNEVIPEDVYDLRFGIEEGWDDETDSPIVREVEEPFGISALPEAEERGWLMHNVYAAAKDGSGYTGQTPLFEFMVADCHCLDRNFARIDFGEQYAANFFISWHCAFTLPASAMDEPAVYDFIGNKLDTDNYTLTYFERAEFDESDPDSREKVYNEDHPLSEMPKEAGRYFVRLDGEEPYYGTSYVDFDIVDFYAQPLGSQTRYYDGYTLYMGKDETVRLTFVNEPQDEDLIPGWIPYGLEEAGFELKYAPEIIDGVAYAVIGAGNAQESASGSLVIDWYRRSDVFDPQGGVHWDTAEKQYTSTLTIVLKSDAELLGDADGSGEVDAIDATVVQRKVIGLEMPYDSDVLSRGDIDRDRALTIVDATFIQRYSAHVKTPYSIGKEIIED